MFAHLQRLRLWLLAWAALSLLSGVYIARGELARQQDVFDTNARIVHRLLSQQVVQHDAILATLALLQERHNATFPFETLTTLLRDAVAIDLPSVAHKLLREGRGGYCYELNGLFLALLQHLGFDARALAARVVMGRADDAPTARTHMLVLVRIDAVDYIADVGFGGNTPTGPLRLDHRFAQATPHEHYRLDQQHDQFVARGVVGAHDQATIHERREQVGVGFDTGIGLAAALRVHRHRAVRALPAPPAWASSVARRCCCARPGPS